MYKLLNKNVKFCKKNLFSSFKLKNAKIRQYRESLSYLSSRQDYVVGVKCIIRLNGRN